jgi:hypothetical protein
MNLFDESLPDPPLTSEQRAIVDSLDDEFLKRVDETLLSHAKKRERKVAMIVGLAMSSSEIRISGLPDIFYAQRVKKLVEAGKLVSEGNLDYMRYSEVRLPQ